MIFKLLFILSTFIILVWNSFIFASDSVQVDWIRQYVSGYNPAFDFVYAISVDASGNIVLAGSSYGDNQAPDFVTIKYNGSGDTLWVRRYNGPGNSWDEARALAIDAGGNVYVTGETYSDSTYFNYVTIKYDAAGNQQWVAQYDGPSDNDDGATGVAVDGTGNVYVTGHSWQEGTSWDYATIKYNSSGQQIWVERYNGPGNIGDFAVGLAIDPLDNIYVTGTADDLSVNFYPAYTTVKYNSNGVQQWAKQYHELWSYAYAIAADSSGSVYVTGRSYGNGTFYDYATVKYNSNGVQQWAARYNGPGGSDDYAYALTVDASGNVYVTGEAFFEAGSGSDYTTIKYNSSGIDQWVARYNGQGSSVDVGKAIVSDASGNIYITGESRNSNGDDDYATIKYNNDGIQQWEVRYNGSGETFDLASALALDAAGNVYVTGRSSQTGGSLITTIKYTEVPIPVELISFTAEVKENIVQLNWETASEKNNRGFEINRSRSSASKEWETIGFVNGRGTTTEPSFYSFTDKIADGNYSYRLKQIDYNGTQKVVGELTVNPPVPEQYSLEQNFPNPFNPTTRIKYSIPNSELVSIKVYDILGNEIETLIDEEKPAGTYEVSWNEAKLPSGVYFYKLKAAPVGGQAGDATTSSGQSIIQTKKMILLR
jgi:uncharacterized delta-60 repeat protein